MSFELPDAYYLETVEQLRVLADDLRQRIMLCMRARPMTVTQIGEQLHLAPAKIHYHVRELHRVGLVKLVATREKGGILEKYFRPVARDVLVPPSLLGSLSADEQVATVGVLLGEIERSFMRALGRSAEQEGSGQGRTVLSRNHLWLTDEEFPAVIRAIEQALAPYQQPRGVAGELERSFIQMMYETAAGADEAADQDTSVELADASQGDAGPSIRRTISTGAVSWDRQELEEVVGQSQVLDLTVLGYLAIADDVPADLVDKAILRLHHRGILRASPAVRAVLKGKEEPA